MFLSRRLATSVVQGKVGSLSQRFSSFAGHRSFPRYRCAKITRIAPLDAGWSSIHVVRFFGSAAGTEQGRRRRTAANQGED